MRTRIGGLALCVVALVATGCEGRASDPPAPHRSPTDGPTTAEMPSEVRSGEWTRLPRGPLSPREGATAFWVDGELYVLGGTSRTPCPPQADCALPRGPIHRDGAAYAPATGEWRTLAQAPIELLVYSGAVRGSRIAVLTNAGVAEYDTRADSWRTLPSPLRAGGGRLVAMGEDIVFVHATHEMDDQPRPDVRLDSASGDWVSLPADPLGPSYDRTAHWTGRELVLLAAKLVPNPGSDGPSVTRAAAFDPAEGSWRALPDSEIVAVGATWHAVAGRLVSAASDGADGGQTNGWGRTYPFGGILDPDAAAWSPLPPREAGMGGAFPVSVAGEEVVVHEGWLLHVPSGRWTRVPDGPALPTQGMAAAWAGDRLVLWGGSSFPRDMEGVLHDDGWYWMPTG